MEQFWVNLATTDKMTAFLRNYFGHKKDWKTGGGGGGSFSLRTYVSFLFQTVLGTKVF